MDIARRFFQPACPSKRVFPEAAYRVNREYSRLSTGQKSAPFRTVREEALSSDTPCFPPFSVETRLKFLAFQRVSRHVRTVRRSSHFN
jgi:hypothetical protein